MSSLPWLCIGDFNEVLHSAEKHGGPPRQRRLIEDFREAVDDCELMDMGFRGPGFTWSNRREGSAMVQERGAVRRVAKAISKCGQQLGRWNARKKKELRYDILETQKQLRESSDHIQAGSWELIRKLEFRLDILLEEEEMYWKQRSRVEWLKGGDKNSKFFHLRATARRSRNLIEGLFDERGIRREGNVEVEKVVTKYFSGLFTAGVVYSEDVDTVLNSLQPRLSPQSCNFLDTPFTFRRNSAGNLRYGTI
ncbi:hypothetical protein Dsin_025516 [Dipteronia sinensis]|uniref:Reverse transcriptase n=1 Tax=Dipteronia sinensis TaxID=43782 RepID=A0AAE0DX73_9ROSI|nr:hypothetical protein Dsin_025516 [Dipteronia sinensis]